ncbi:hypothetical protein [Pedobacter sp. Hv1]|uniref:helix-turn-helix transcriptional regulator n=1 Tax=Pedobacter sp. Hv1 TaxID=1740090 RepID=UPI000AA1DDAF|nr:hypothetical protein [Pedobacter sp. Hv1]
MVFFISVSAFSQTIPSKNLIKVFKRSDVDQTQKFADLCSELLLNFNERNFNLRVREIQKYLRNNTDERVRIRTFMYERFGYQKINKPDTLNTAIHYFKMIKLAGPLKDEQLLSELYSKYAALCAPSEKLYYLLKCIGIREHIGLSHFSDISANYYWASELLYSITDYRSSSTYAARCVSLYKEKDKRDFLLHYILAVDLAGASYLKINQPDSAIYYYQHINNLIDDRIANPSRYKSPMTPQMLEVWRGVVKGGMAKAYMLQKKYAAAYTLLLQNLKSSTHFEQWDDVAGVQNSLAKIDELEQRIPLAISRYLQAYHLASKSSKLAILESSAEGLSTAFATQQQYDSAYIYHKRYLQWKSKLDQNINQSRLDIVKTQVDFEKMEKELLQSQNNLLNQKRIRNSILITIVFLTAIALLLYNRKRLQMSLQNEKLEKEKQISDAGIIYAQQQIDFFIQNIAEKNNLVKQLQTQLTMADNAEVTLALNHFTILTEEDWQKFKVNFETINPRFLYRLKQKMPQITQGEQRVMVLTKLGFSTKEMANATGVSSETIRSVISRMRKKFNLNADIRTIANEI